MIAFDVPQRSEQIAASFEHAVESRAFEPERLVELLDCRLRGIHPSLGLVDLGLAAAECSLASLDFALQQKSRCGFEILARHSGRIVGIESAFDEDLILWQSQRLGQLASVALDESGQLGEFRLGLFFEVFCQTQGLLGFFLQGVHRQTKRVDLLGDRLLGRFLKKLIGMRRSLMQIGVDPMGGIPHRPQGFRCGLELFEVLASVLGDHRAELHSLGQFPRSGFDRSLHGRYCIVGRKGFCFGKILLDRGDQGFEVAWDGKEVVLGQLRQLSFLVDHLLEFGLASIEFVVDPCQRVVDDLERFASSLALALDGLKDFVEGHHHFIGDFFGWLFSGFESPLAQDFHGDGRNPCRLVEFQGFA